MHRTSEASPGYQFFMFALCLYSLGLLAFAASGPAPETQAIVEYVDFAVCMVFMGDFLVSLYRAESRWRYFITWGWIDLLSSIPAFDVARWGRAARILRIFRLLRGVRATKILVTAIMKQRAHNAILAASLIALLLVTFCSIAILHFESSAGGNIKSAEDAVWWSFTTITTVGYGDRFPTTREGRMIAVMLMSGGVGLFGIFSGFLASWFVGEDGETQNAELKEVKEELARLRQMLEQK